MLTLAPSLLNTDSGSALIGSNTLMVCCQGELYQALYDYEAADDDEASFMEGDTISGVQPVDDGWVTGVVQRTGVRGMIPSNYIAPM